VGRCRRRAPSVSGRLGAIPAARRIKSRSVPGIQSVAAPSATVETVGYSSMHACTRIEGSFSTCSPAQETNSYCHRSSDQDNSASTERTRTEVAHSLCRFRHVCIRAPFSTLSTAFRDPYTASPIRSSSSVGTARTAARLSRSLPVAKRTEVKTARAGQGTATDQKVPMPQPLPSPSGSVVRKLGNCSLVRSPHDRDTGPLGRPRLRPDHSRAR
jgi:hypothetical protein